MPYAMYLEVNGHAHDLPGSFGQALSTLQSANFYYGQAVGKRLDKRLIEAEHSRIHEAEQVLYRELENILTLFSYGKLHRPGVPDHDVAGSSRTVDLAPALSDWQGGGG